MKDFSNETKNKRRKAILKVILKRYSFVVWVPVLLIISNFIGVTFGLLVGESTINKGYSIFFNYLLNAMMGFIIGIMLLFIILLIAEMIKDLIKYLKKGTIIDDFITNIKLTAEILVEIFHFFISLPKRIFLRIKDEKRRFNNSVEKEMRDEFYYD